MDRVPVARVRPRGVGERLTRAGAAVAGGVWRAIRFVVNVIGTAFGV